MQYEHKSLEVLKKVGKFYKKLNLVTKSLKVLKALTQLYTENQQKTLYEPTIGDLEESN